MDAHIQPFLFEAEHLVRVVGDDEDLWFVAKDVCAALEIVDVSRAVSRLDDDEKGATTTRTLGGAQEMLTVNESGLYSLIFTSRKPSARRFRKWVTAEVLPAIRKIGSYGAVPMTGEVLSDPPADRPFPHWSMEEMRTKKGCVDMYRLLYGTMAAQWISPQLGFPAPPVELVEHGRQFSLVLVPTNGGMR